MMKKNAITQPKEGIKRFFSRDITINETGFVHAPKTDGKLT